MNPLTGDWPIARPLLTQGSTTQNIVDMHPCLPEFETTILMFERAKTIRALDRVVTGTG